jgi:hypothetical protein
VRGLRPGSTSHSSTHARRPAGSRSPRRGFLHARGHRPRARVGAAARPGGGAKRRTCALQTSRTAHSKRTASSSYSSQRDRSDPASTFLIARTATRTLLFLALRMVVAREARAARRTNRRPALPSQAARSPRLVDHADAEHAARGLRDPDRDGLAAVRCALTVAVEGRVQALLRVGSRPLPNPTNVTEGLAALVADPRRSGRRRSLRGLPVAVDDLPSAHCSCGPRGRSRRQNQSSTRRPFTRSKCFRLCVTRVSPRESACAAIIVSSTPIGTP